MWLIRQCRLIDWQRVITLSALVAVFALAWIQCERTQAAKAVAASTHGVISPEAATAWQARANGSPLTQ